MDRDEWLGKVKELKSRPGAKGIAVNNFLITVDANHGYTNAYLNLSMDRNLYKWNKETVEAIAEGIGIYYEVPDSEQKTWLRQVLMDHPRTR